MDIAGKKPIVKMVAIGVIVSVAIIVLFSPMFWKLPELRLSSTASGAGAAAAISTAKAYADAVATLERLNMEIPKDSREVFGFSIEMQGRFCSLDAAEPGVAFAILVVYTQTGLAIANSGGVAIGGSVVTKVTIANGVNNFLCKGGGCLTDEHKAAIYKLLISIYSDSGIPWGAHPPGCLVAKGLVDPPTH